MTSGDAGCTWTRLFAAVEGPCKDRLRVCPLVRAGIEGGVEFMVSANLLS